MSTARDDDSVFSSLQQVAGVRYNRAEHNRDIIDTYMLRKAREKGIRLPTGGAPEEYKYLGAHVETPTAGMSENVVYIDVSSMYPNSIVTLNASPETIIGTQEDLDASQYTEEDCVWGYIDPRPVYHLSKGEDYRDKMDGTYKMVYDPHKNDKKWSCDEPPWSSKPTGDGPNYTKLYILDHDTQKGFLTECVEKLIDLKNQYRGTSLYASTKRVTNCFTEDTDILTPDGRVPVTELSEGDPVYTFDTDTQEVRETTVDETYAYPEYSGTVYRFHNEDVDLEVTPLHGMCYLDADGDVVEGDAMALAQELTSRDVVIPSARGVDDSGAVLTSEDVDRYRTSFGTYCVNVGGENTVLAGRNGTVTPVHQSVYGVTGFANESSSFRLFDWRLAEAVTLTGRKMIQYSRDYVLDHLREQGYDDVYPAIGDTDGCGIAIPSASTRHEAMDAVEQAVEELNGEGYDEFFQSEFNVPSEKHRGEIEIESYAPRLFVPSMNPPHGEIGRKKRYIQWETWNDDDGEVDDISITGLEAVRSDVAPLATEAQEAFAETLRMDEGEAREYLFPQLREWAEQVRSGDIELDRVCKRSGIGQDLSEYGSETRRASTFYRGAKYATKHIDGVTVQRGDKPRLVYVKDVRGDYPSTYTADTAEDGDPVDAVTVPEPSRLPDAFVVDWDAHWKKALKGPMQPLLETRFGKDAWPQVLHDHEQAGLGTFAD